MESPRPYLACGARTPRARRMIVRERRDGSRYRAAQSRATGRKRAGRSGAGRTPELTLQDAWRRSAGRGHRFKASDGRSYRVLYAGRRGGSYGPDFKDAVLLRDDGRRVSGDVEIHVRRVDWRTHGHDRDPRYNGVTFHAFIEGEVGAGTATPARRDVREIHVGALLAKPSGKREGEAGLPDAEPPPVSAPLPLPLDLATAGEERFAAKVSGAELSVRRSGADQAAYSAVLECLGYHRNKRQFRQFAERLPWAVVAAHLEGDAPDVERIEALMLWAGGFGRKPAWARPLRGATPAWTLPAGRPDNAPKRRLLGAARLAARWAACGGPARALAACVVQAAGPKDVIRRLEVPGEDGGRALVGRSRAAEIAVNAVLPAVSAASCLPGGPGVSSKAAQLYRQFPPLPENAITREARRIFSKAPSRGCPGYGAREQQGLIYLYRALTLPIDMTKQLPLRAGTDA